MKSTNASKVKALYLTVDRSSRIFKSLILLAGILFLAGCSGFENIRKPDGNEAKKQSLTVMSFNIRHGCGVKDWGNTSSYFFRSCEKNIDLVVLAIKSANPDVVGLQEVDNGQAKKLSIMLNMNYAYYSHNLSGYGAWWGNAILSKAKILDASVKRIGGTINRNRSIVLATMEINGRPTVFISIHTHHKLYQPHSVRKIMAKVNDIPHPVVLIGDFNMSSEDDRWEEFKRIPEGEVRNLDLPRISHRIFVDTAQEVDTPGAKETRNEGTFPSIGRIDYVLVEEKYFDVLAAGLVPRKYRNASDHYAYFTIIKPKP